MVEKWLVMQYDGRDVKQYDLREEQEKLMATSVIELKHLELPDNEV